MALSKSETINAYPISDTFSSFKDLYNLSAETHDSRTPDAKDDGEDSEGISS